MVIWFFFYVTKVFVARSIWWNICCAASDIYIQISMRLMVVLTRRFVYIRVDFDCKGFTATYCHRKTKRRHSCRAKETNNDESIGNILLLNMHILVLLKPLRFIKCLCLAFCVYILSSHIPVPRPWQIKPYYYISQQKWLRNHVTKYNKRVSFVNNLKFWA